MNVIKKLTAIFNFKGRRETVELDTAEITREGVILHTLDDPEHSFYVKTENVAIHINPLSEVTEDDILVLDNKKKKDEKEPRDKKNEKEPEYPDLRYIRPRALTQFMPSKKRFSVMLYEDEYDMLMKTIQDNGYKKVEYFLACML